MKKSILAIFAVGLVALLAVGLVSALPFGESFMKKDVGDTQIKEKMEAFHEAIENKDYEAWKMLMEERVANMQNRINEEHFQEILERHDSREEFKAEMEELREEYGFEGRGFGKMRNH